MHSRFGCFSKIVIWFYWSVTVPGWLAMSSAASNASNKTSSHAGSRCSVTVSDAPPWTQSLSQPESVLSESLEDCYFTSNVSTNRRLWHCELIRCRLCRQGLKLTQPTELKSCHNPYVRTWGWNPVWNKQRTLSSWLGARSFSWLEKTTWRTMVF